MQNTISDTFSLWQAESRRSIPENFEVFRSLVERASNDTQQGKYDIAAGYACGKHCGLFASPELEHVLLEIGRKAIPSDRDRDIATNRPLNHVLHVATAVHSIGGHSRMLLRWIQQDAGHSHSLVLTQQVPYAIPPALRSAVLESGGRIYILNKQIGSLLAWAKQLRKIAVTADLVVLHIHNFDVIPILAFADKDRSQPLLFVDHADHLFWVGASISDVVISLRDSGMQLAQQRRGIELNRSKLLPIVLDPIHRTIDRPTAKRQLGIAADTIVLLSIARSLKYRTIDGLSFAAAHVPLLTQYPQAILIVVGVGDRPDWQAAIEQTQGRIRVVSETDATAIFYQAADIYVDSFPFVSNTSLLEAGSYVTPLVSRYPYRSDTCGILGADMPGLTGNLIRVRNLEEYTQQLAQLIADPEHRLSVGAATSLKIAQTHWGRNWQSQLDDIYTHATAVSRSIVTSTAKDEMFLDELDIFLPQVHGADLDLDRSIQTHLPIMPPLARLTHWFSLLQTYGWRHNPPHWLLPQWFRSVYYSLDWKSWFTRGDRHLDIKRK
jgi:hypothetical protein